MLAMLVCLDSFTIHLQYSIIICCLVGDNYEDQDGYSDPDEAEDEYDDRDERTVTDSSRESDKRDERQQEKARPSLTYRRPEAVGMCLLLSPTLYSKYMYLHQCMAASIQCEIHFTIFRLQEHAREAYNKMHAEKGTQEEHVRKLKTFLELDFGSQVQHSFCSVLVPATKITIRIGFPVFFFLNTALWLAIVHALSPYSPPQGEFQSLHEKCFQAPVKQYEYEVCVYKSASQKEGGRSTSLGQWSGWELDDDGVRFMKFEGGESCWQGPQR